MSITPPTPAEVAEARAWFEKRQTRYGTGPEYWIADAGDGQRHAAVLVRAALAAPAEQPREDYCRCGARRGTAHPKNCRDRCWDCGGDPDGPNACQCARSVSPSAVPAVSDTSLASPSPSAGGAGRDLTAQDVQQVWRDVPSYGEHREVFQWIAEHLNLIARPADTGTQATEQTTLFRLVGEDGDTVSNLSAIRDTDWYGSYDDADYAARNGLVSDYGPLRIESATARVVSPWSPVDVHDEEQQR